MIHHSCDRCKRMLGPDELRFEVRIEVQAALESGDDDGEMDSQVHLDELQDVLDQLDPADCQELCQQALSHMRFDLCRQCHADYLENPVGGKVAQPVSIGFGPN